MKGPHFFAKLKKEQARQQKQKEKAARRAQRRAGKEDTPDDAMEVEGEGETATAEPPAEGGASSETG
ncbi:MAG TPA: hypothetical protein VH877_22250 [Polyangia bacterium]|jgi:hypothetical protein|nr:hypothetical protein [Polyangia bacterium]